MTLEEVRAQWEKGLESKCVIDLGDAAVVLVVLQKGERYHCHRYFQVGSAWEVSVDQQGVDLERVWKWLEDPVA